MHSLTAHTQFTWAFLPFVSLGHRFSEHDSRSFLFPLAEWNVVRDPFNFNVGTYLPNDSERKKVKNSKSYLIQKVDYIKIYTYIEE